MTLSECFKILNLQEGVSLDEVKKAYKKMSMKYHPDRNDGDFIAGEMFKKIKDAYDVIEAKYKSDPGYIREQELKALKAEFNRLLAQYKSRGEEIQHLKEEVNHLKTARHSISTLEKQLRESKTAMQSLKNQHIFDLRREQDRTNNERKDNAAKITKIHQEMDQIRQELNAALKERDALQAKYLSPEQLKVIRERELNIKKAKEAEELRKQQEVKDNAKNDWAKRAKEFQESKKKSYPTSNPIDGVEKFARWSGGLVIVILLIVGGISMWNSHVLKYNACIIKAGDTYSGKELERYCNKNANLYKSKPEIDLERIRSLIDSMDKAKTMEELNAINDEIKRRMKIIGEQ